MKTLKSFLKEISYVCKPVNIHRAKITNINDAIEYGKLLFPQDIAIREYFYILHLNRGHHTLCYDQISKGGVNGTVVDTKLIAKGAIESLCSAVILYHNHPSGAVIPSSSDIKITHEITEVLKIINITVIDHIIISGVDYKSYSFADKELINLKP